MPTLKPITEQDIPRRTVQESASGKLLNDFLNSTTVGAIAQVDFSGDTNRKGEPIKGESLRSSLGSYAARQDLPVTVSLEGGMLVLRHVTPDEARTFRAANKARRAGAAKAQATESVPTEEVA